MTRSRYRSEICWLGSRVLYSEYVGSRRWEGSLLRLIRAARIEGSCGDRVVFGNRANRIRARRATIAAVAEAWQRCRMAETGCAGRMSAPHPRRAREALERHTLN